MGIKTIKEMPDLHKDVLEHLHTKKEGQGLNLKELSDVLEKDEAGSGYKVPDLREEMRHLIDQGYVMVNQSIVEGKPDNKYFLTKNLGAGYRARNKLYGTHWTKKIEGLYKRINPFGFFLTILGAVLFIFSSHSISGDAVLVSSGVGHTGLIFGSAALLIIGIALLSKSKK